MNTEPARVLAIDGTVASGKSSTAKRLAKELGFAHLDSGSLYRSVTWLCLQEEIDPTDTALVSVFARDCVKQISVFESITYIDENPVGEEIRTQLVSDATSIVAEIPEVRQLLSHIQRGCINPIGLVAEGRDMTSVVFWDALLKVFITTKHPETRAKRRFAEKKHAPHESEADVLAKLVSRDKKDTERTCCPLIRTPDSVFIENDILSLDDVVRILHESWKVRIGDPASVAA